jgi:transcriptional regulator with XRE-family HTH domain
MIDGEATSKRMPSESPAVARRRLRLALRRVREAQRVTQSQIAEALEWSLSKVNRIESGDVTISNTDLRALLEFLGVTDAAVIEHLTDQARASRQRGWWDQPQYREHLTPSTLQLLQFESEATAIRTFQPTLFPGLLQTREYAAAILDVFADAPGGAAPDVRLAARMRRRAQLLERPDPPTYYVVVEESVVQRHVGGRPVMVGQLRSIIDTSHSSAAIIRVLPLARGAPSMLGAFTIFDLGDEENAVLYREYVVGDEIVESPEDIRRYRQMFEQIWDNSLSDEESVRLIDENLRTLVNHDQDGQS